MSAKTIIILCAQALLIQSVFSQCINRAAVDAIGLGPYGLAGPGLAYDGLAAPWAYDGLAYPGTGCAGLAYDGLYAPGLEFSPTSGGSFPVTSFSALPPIGLSIVSENVFEGPLYVVGELPFVGTTALEGALPTVGSGAINHACGNGLNAMSALSPTSTEASVATMTGAGIGAPGLIAPGLLAPGFAYDGLMALGFAYDGLMAPAFAAPGLAGPFGYDRFAPGFAASGLTAPGFVAPGFAYDGLAYASPIDALDFTPTTGGALPVSSASAVPPTGLSVASENAYEGVLASAGELPFVGTVGVDGVLPTAGAGAINHACGDGHVRMGSPATIAPVDALYGYRGGVADFAYPAAGFAGRGCGYAF